MKVGCAALWKAAAVKRDGSVEGVVAMAGMAAGQAGEVRDVTTPRPSPRTLRGEETAGIEAMQAAAQQEMVLGMALRVILCAKMRDGTIMRIQ